MTRKLVFVSESDLIKSGSSSSSDCSINSSTASFTTCSSDAISQPIPAVHSSNPVPKKVNSNEQLNLAKCPKKCETKSKRQVITNFEDLCELKPRSRLPIDIQQPPVMLKSLDNSTNSQLNLNLSLSHSLQTSKSSDCEMINRLQALAEPSCNDDSLNQTNKQNRKYFSFMTTNKLFADMTRKSIDNSELRLKIVNDQLINEIDHRETSTVNQMGFTKLNSRFSSSASSTTSENSHIGSDSGCGSSIAARSSILSNCEANESNLKFIGVDKSFKRSEEDYETSNQMKSLCEKIFVKKAPVNCNLNLSINNSLIKPSKRSMDLKKSTDYSINETNVSTSACNVIKKHRTKLLTILFDYETSCKSYAGTKSSFSVKKGQSVKVLRDYDEKFYLVATIPDGRIGFVPKDYTVDLKEVEKRFNSKLKIVSTTARPELNSNLSIAKETMNQHFLNAKLTHC